MAFVFVFLPLNFIVKTLVTGGAFQAFGMYFEMYGLTTPPPGGVFSFCDIVFINRPVTNKQHKSTFAELAMTCSGWLL